MSDRPTILLVDDDQVELLFLGRYFQKWGYNWLSVSSGAGAIKFLKTHAVDLIISDQEMDEIDGLELLQQVKHAYPDIPFMMLTAYEDHEKAVMAMKLGASDYLAKSINPVQLQAKISHLLKYSSAFLRERDEQEQQIRGAWCKALITISPKMRAMLKQAYNVARSLDTTVLISGETGTGKELLARAIHEASSGAQNPFVGVNCAGIPANLLESELFGHVKGAFTGADRNRQGKFALAGHGTILLDEIGDMPVDLQTKLLRVLQERVYEKIGSNTSENVKCRVIVATHENLQELMDVGQFREDLFYRINEFPITIPPLRERKEDILLLANHFMKHFCKKYDRHIPGLSSETMEYLLNYQWPGNVRELKYTLKRAVLSVDDGPIRPCHLIIPRYGHLQSARDRGESGLWIDEQSIRLILTSNRKDFSLERLIRDVLQATLKACDNNLSQAAEFLKIDRKMFYRRGIRSSCSERVDS